MKALLVLTILLSSSNLTNSRMLFLQKEPILLADPTIFRHKGVYYLYGTTADPKMGRDKGFLVYTSKDLENWQGPVGTSNGLALKKGDAYGDTGFWAPQVFEYNDKFYMAYTANEQIAMATSDSPLGPFIDPEKKNLEAAVKQIDPFVFIDDDGKKYLYHVRLADGNRIFVAELNDDLKSIKPETLTECLSGEMAWENTQNTEWPVTEGPTVVKHKGLYYLIYSANDFRNPDYAVGYATSKSPMGPWKKWDRNPIIHKSGIGFPGPGHGDVLQDENNNLQYVMHTHFDAYDVHPRRTAIVKIDFGKDGKSPDRLSVEKEAFRFLKK